MTRNETDAVRPARPQRATPCIGAGEALERLARDLGYLIGKQLALELGARPRTSSEDRPIPGGNR